MPGRDDEFYVGYLPRCPRGIAVFVRVAAVSLLALAAGVSLLLVTGQDRFDAGVFEFGVDTVFEGVVIERPYPMLLVPEVPGGDGTFTTHTLVAPGKHGAGALVAGLDGRTARVTGSRIFSDGQRMIEAHAVAPLEGEAAARLRSIRAAEEVRLGVMTLAGEIVDSKCHFGVMKPGRGRPHQACAIRCISGGIPPVLRVEDREGKVDFFLLVSDDGRPVNQQVLGLVAEPVEITGTVARAGDRLILYADPANYRLIEPAD